MTIQDLGDSIYDSAVFLDNFSWLVGINCATGAFVDTDGDGLLDVWETNGIDIDGNGSIDLDLPAMGADPRHKDIFIEADYMVDKGFCFLSLCFGGHSHQPKADALQRVIDAFAAAPVSNPDGTAGITLHIDAGPDSIMNPRSNPPTTWGTRSRATALGHDDELGACPTSQGRCVGEYDWSEFDAIKGVGTSGSFPIERRDAFHYVIFAHKLGASTHSGLSRGISASDLIVSLGDRVGSVGTVSEQAGTLMHELGNNLGLQHGGGDPDNYKPNYLSVMNYSFQTRGLRKGGVDANFDYSFVDLPDLNENSLDEKVGLSGGAAISGYGARYYCGGTEQILNNANGAIDWNCDSDATDAGVAQDVNNENGLGTLQGYNDWAHIRFDGGAIGKLGEVADLPMHTTAEEITTDGDAKLSSPFAVRVTGPGEIFLLPGPSVLYRFQVANTGQNTDTYSLTATSMTGWADLSGLPGSITLPPGDTREISSAVTVPLGTPLGTQDKLVIKATSTTNPLLMDAVTTLTTVGVLDTDHDGQADAEESGPAGSDPDFDGNGDGLPDRLQANVTSLHTADGTHYITLAAPPGTILAQVRAVPNPSPHDTPLGVAFPYGFFEFSISGLSPGGLVTLTMYFPGPTTGFYKWGPTPGNAANHWYSFLFDGDTGASFVGNQVRLAFRNGARGDDDLDNANGVIVDQGGPTVPKTETPAPLLSGPALIGLVGLLGLIGVMGLLRRPTG